MKILLISPFTSASGSAIRFWNMAEQFALHGYRVVYVDREKKGHAPLHQVPGVAYRPSRVVQPFVLDILLSTLYNLYIVLTNLDCSLIYALKPAPNNCFAALLARVLGKTIVLDIDDLDYEYLNPGLKRTVSRFFFRFFPRFFPLVTCHTPNLIDYCKNELHIPANRLYYLAQGVSPEFLANPITNPPARHAIVYVATLGITSDFEELLPMLATVCKKFPATIISIIGDGVKRSVFERRAEQLGLSRNIVFKGNVPHAELPALLSQHTIGLNYMKPLFVNNCRAILKIREYLARGLQVVCNNTGDASLFCKHAFVEADMERMEKRLCELLASSPIMNSGGRVFIEKEYSWSSIMNTFLSDHCSVFNIKR
jgi:glycosyltransferase involved in cell wall biosynthesis